MDVPEQDPRTGRIIDAAIRVHRHLGPGLREKTYEECLARELQKRGIAYRRQVRVPVRYDGEVLPAHYRLDFVVEEEIVVELKCIHRILPMHRSQLLTYLRHSGLRTGLLLNFAARTLVEGIARLSL
jgi:GxxExxY protein